MVEGILPETTILDLKQKLKARAAVFCTDMDEETCFKERGGHS